MINSTGTSNSKLICDNQICAGKKIIDLHEVIENPCMIIVNLSCDFEQFGFIGGVLFCPRTSSRNNQMQGCQTIWTYMLN